MGVATEDAKYIGGRVAKAPPRMQGVKGSNSTQILPVNQTF